MEGARRLVNINREHAAEILERKSRLEKLNGQLFRRYANHFMRSEAETKLGRLRTAFEAVEDLCERRRVIYDQNLDLRNLLNDIEGELGALFLYRASLLVPSIQLSFLQASTHG